MPDRKPSSYSINEKSLLLCSNAACLCTVLNGRQVEHEGISWALSYLTNKLLDHEGPIRGTAYWTYQGKPLTEIYDETYAEY